MIQQPWTAGSKRHLVCVDSYCNGVFEGRFYEPGQGGEHFPSLSKFLLRMEQLLDQQKAPQASTSRRRFSDIVEVEDIFPLPDRNRRGAKATFELQIIFRQHSSWQGILQWREQGVEHSFRSVLELISLMDSALRSSEGSGVPQA